MYKNEYLKRLRNALKDVDNDEAERLVEYYREIIEDGLERGGGEDFISKLEPPELVAQNYKREQGIDEEKRDYCESNNEDKGSLGKTKTQNGGGNSGSGTPSLVKILMIIACVFFAFVGAIVLFSVSVAAFSCCCKGLFAFFTAFGLLGSHTAVAFAQIGYAILVAAIGVLLVYAVIILAKGYRYVILFLSSKNPKMSFKVRKILLLCGAGAFAVGLIIFVVSFAALGFSIDKLACVDDMVLKQESFANPNENFALISDNIGLEIKYSSDDKIRLEYYEFENEPKQISESNGVVTFKTDKSFLDSWARAFKRGVFFSNRSSKYYETTLYLPVDFEFDVALELDNGAIKINKMNFKNLTLDTKNGAININEISALDVKVSTNNGAVKVEDCTFANLIMLTKNGAIMLKDLEIEGEAYAQANNGAIKMVSLKAASIWGEADNGAVKLEKCSAQKVYGKTNNGAISLVDLCGDDIELISGNGAITGSIAGKKSDYIIDASTGNGSNNLSNTTSGTKKLKAKTGNGAIKITFKDSL